MPMRLGQWQIPGIWLIWDRQQRCSATALSYTMSFVRHGNNLEFIKIHAERECRNCNLAGRVPNKQPTRFATAVSGSLRLEHRQILAFHDRRWIPFAGERIGLWAVEAHGQLRLEFMGGLSYTTIIELAELLAHRRGSALDR
jgi:hypothetical protein